MARLKKYTLFALLVLALQQTGNSQPISDLSRFCDYTGLIDNVPSPEKEEREKLYLQLVGVLHELWDYRQKYRTAGHFMDIFPSVYYHITSLEMDKIRLGAYQHPTWKMSQMLAFYEAYSVNRRNWDTNNKGAVEPHWVNHFTVANEQYNGVNWLCTGIQQTLNTAINAHVIYDLPRSIRFAFNNKTNPNLTESDIKPEFMAVNASFSSALQFAVDDIEEASSLICDFFINIGQLLLPSDVILKRQSAWYDAFNSGKVLQYNGSPLSQHPYSAVVRSQLADKGKNRCNGKVNATLFLFDL
ncbi:MAG: hypothetical protein KDF58_14925, partial [Alphaproteobacteria bacterium]|nr:hypothetical protein [Alphaproteobacteria bacterium]